jgi:hypothetical protein
MVGDVLMLAHLDSERNQILKNSFLVAMTVLLAMAFFVFVKIGLSAPAPIRMSFTGEVISTAPAYKAMLFAPFLAALLYFALDFVRKRQSCWIMLSQPITDKNRSVFHAILWVSWFFCLALLLTFQLFAALMA